MSDDEWNFKTKDDMIYIENISKTKVLETSKILPTQQDFDKYNLVILQDFEEDKAEQLWKKGESNAEGYFTLENYKVPQVLTKYPVSGIHPEQIATLENSKVPMMMTATSSIRLEINGNITLRWIFY